MVIETMMDSHGAAPTLDRFVALGYFFLLVSIVDLGSDPSYDLTGVFAPIGGGVYPGAVMLGVLLVGAVALLGVYARKTWGLVVCIGIFGFYSMLMLYAGELTIAGVAALCVIYLLSRVDIVLDTES